MLNVVSNLFISGLKECLLDHKCGIQAKLPPHIVLPYPVFCLCKQFIPWYKIWAVWWKEHDHCSCGMNPVYYCSCVVDSRFI